jgi:uncharacterized DUF497 family protein
MIFSFNREKNAKLLSERGIGFEEIIQAIHDGNLLDIAEHPNKEFYPHQKILYVRIIYPHTPENLFIYEEDGRR